MKSLPTTTDRESHGLKRTVCGCDECVMNCEFIPGFLLPEDVEPLYQATSKEGEDLVAWAKRCLLASPGALVMKATRNGWPDGPVYPQGAPFRIETVVPARKPDGSCVFLTAEKKCLVHPISPFGCAFADVHMPEAQGKYVSMVGLNVLAEEKDKPVTDSPYYLLWNMLTSHGLTTPPPEQTRARMLAEHKRRQEAKRNEV